MFQKLHYNEEDVVEMKMGRISYEHRSKNIHSKLWERLFISGLVFPLRLTTCSSLHLDSIFQSTFLVKICFLALLSQRLHLPLFCFDFPPFLNLLDHFNNLKMLLVLLSFAFNGSPKIFKRSEGVSLPY